MNLSNQHHSTNQTKPIRRRQSLSKMKRLFLSRRTVFPWTSKTPLCLSMIFFSLSSSYSFVRIAPNYCTLLGLESVFYALPSPGSSILSFLGAKHVWVKDHNKIDYRTKTAIRQTNRIVQCHCDLLCSSWLTGATSGGCSSLITLYQFIINNW